jgi:hypothetical protein
MKKILTPKLTLKLLDYSSDADDAYPYQYMDDDQRWKFCYDELIERFELPRETETIQFEARSERFPGSMKVKFGLTLVCGEPIMVLTLEDDVQVYLYASTHDDINTALGKRRRTWYVKLYYWE